MRRLLLAASLVAVFVAAQARAHFLFLRITPPAEGGRSAEVYFSEYAQAGDPRYIDKVAGATFWLQSAPGEFQPLAAHKLSDRLRAHVPTTGPLMVAGQLDYGVLKRPLPFLLRHYCKAVAGKPEEVNRLAAKGTPLELTATFDKERVLLTALLGGKPLANTKITTVDADLSNEELTTDADGKAEFKPSHPGYFCLYVGHTDRAPGEHKGEKYGEVKAFATLSFAWPLVAAGPDDEAVALFEEALASRAAWQNFPGFTAKIAGDIEGRPFAGNVTVAADGGVTLKLDDDEDALAPWVQDQLASITMHRAAGPTSGANRPKPAVRFADEQVDHPLGRLLAFDGGQFASSYRVKDKQLTTVNRVLDGKNMTITVIDNDKNAEGRYLPRSYVVQYWDEKTGQLDRIENVQDRWHREGQWDLPARHTVSTSSGEGFSVRSFELTDHKVNAAGK